MLAQVHFGPIRFSTDIWASQNLSLCEGQDYRIFFFYVFLSLRAVLKHFGLDLLNVSPRSSHFGSSPFWPHPFFSVSLYLCIVY